MRQGQWNRLSETGKHVAGFIQDMDGILAGEYLAIMTVKQRKALNTMARRGIVRQQDNGDVIFVKNVPYSKEAICLFVSPFKE